MPPDVIELTKEESAFFTSKGEEAPAADPSPTPDPTPAADPAPQLDPAPATDPEPAEKEAKGGVVPQQALHEERERRKAEKKRADEATANFLKLQSRLDTLAEVARAQQPPAPQAPAVEIPDINVDPVGHFKAKDTIREKELADLKAWKTAQEQQFQQTNNVQRISQIAQVQEAEFKKTTPDYDAASQHLMGQRDAELLAYGIVDPMERKNIIAQDAIQIATNALANNKNPAQVIYEMSKARGYTATAAKPATASAAPANTPTEAEKVRMAAAGQKAGASLGQLNGAASPPTTLEALAKMSDSEFAEATQGGKWRKLMGGE